MSRNAGRCDVQGQNLLNGDAKIGAHVAPAVQELNRIIPISSFRLAVNDIKSRLEAGPEGPVYRP